MPSLAALGLLILEFSICAMLDADLVQVLVMGRCFDIALQDTLEVKLTMDASQLRLQSASDRALELHHGIASGIPQ